MYMYNIFLSVSLALNLVSIVCTNAVQISSKWYSICGYICINVIADRAAGRLNSAPPDSVDGFGGLNAAGKKSNGGSKKKPPGTIRWLRVTP